MPANPNLVKTFDQREEKITKGSAISGPLGGLRTYCHRKDLNPAPNVFPRSGFFLSALALS